MRLFDAKNVTAINKMFSHRVTTQFMATKKNYKSNTNQLSKKWCLRGNSFEFDNNPKYNGVVKVIMHLAVVFAN